ncbi:MAG: DUF1837 domain-containing protein [Actinobacteria bacterium]|nr:DUF1837 domain-containing protein [Actinomycetota bacterium]
MSESTTSGLGQFVAGGRLALTFEDFEPIRAVYATELVRKSEVSELESYMADRVPYFYKSPREIADLFASGYFLSAIADALRKLPLAENFRESHFGEILAGLYGEEILDLRLLYSKLRLLTAENANANKMDLLFFRPGKNPAQFVFAEVKSSMKTTADGLPPGHDKSCFANLFASLNKYAERDLEFDLGLIRERMDDIEPADAAAIRTALLPHTARNIRYAAFCVIDSGTKDHDETGVLGRRESEKDFEVDVLCVADLPEVVQATFEKLDLAV